MFTVVNVCNGLWLSALNFTTTETNKHIERTFVPGHQDHFISLLL